MTLQNRVRPTGEIVAEPWRGALMGNRGILHDESRQLGTARWRHHAWVACRLSFRGRRRDVMGSRRYTELFFWDEAAAFAAGHRPCGECRRDDYRRFLSAWSAAGLKGHGATEINGALHKARVTRDRRQVRHEARGGDLPDGVFVLRPDGASPCLVRGGELWRLDELAGGYTAAGPVPRHVTVLTPAPIIEVIRAGYAPDIRDCG